VDGRLLPEYSDGLLQLEPALDYGQASVRAEPGLSLLRHLAGAECVTEPPPERDPAQGRQTRQLPVEHPRLNTHSRTGRLRPR